MYAIHQSQDVHGSHVLADLVLFLGGPKKVLYVQPYSFESHCPADFNSNHNQTHLFKVFRIIIKQGCPNMFLEDHCHAEFRSSPTYTHMNQLIKVTRNFQTNL